jgi:hypothetical protein
MVLDGRHLWRAGPFPSILAGANVIDATQGKAVTVILPWASPENAQARS